MTIDNAGASATTGGGSKTPTATLNLETAKRKPPPVNIKGTVT